MTRNPDFSEGSDLDFTLDTNNCMDGLIPNPDEDELDPQEIRNIRGWIQR